MYIRTKDGRIISYDENANKIDLPMILNYPNQILKQADTIDELCDKVVYIGKDGYKTILHKTFAFEDNDRPYYKCELTSETGWHRSCKEWLEDGDLYLAIWTSKGLIYVAKMNDKGDLELI